MKALYFVFLITNLMASSVENTDTGGLVPRDTAVGPVFTDIKEPGSFIITAAADKRTQLGDFADTQNKPCCTFLLFIAAIAYDAGVLTGDPYEILFESCPMHDNESHTATGWIQKSCINCSRELIHKIGVEIFIAYFKALGYGNNNISDYKNFLDSQDPNKDIRRQNPCWLSGHLKISPNEQIEMLRKLLNNELRKPDGSSFREGYLHFIRSIFFVEKFNGWTLFGKTGAGNQMEPMDRSDESKGYKETENGHKLGWFIGWVERGIETDAERSFFVRYIHEDKPYEVPKTYPAVRGKAQVIAFMEDNFYAKNS